MTDYSEYILGDHDSVIHVERFEENRAAAIQLATQTKQSIHLLSHDLDPIIYDNTDFVEAIKNIAIGSTRSSIKILIRDSRKIINDGHQLVELARKLSSYIFIRKLNREISTIYEAYLIADETGLLYHKLSERPEGIVNFNDRGQCRQLLTTFNDAWEKSAPDPELRRLHL